MGIRLGIKIDEQEMGIGTKHIALTHQLVHLITCGIGDSSTMLNDVVSDVDGMIVVAPGEVTGCGRRI